MLFLWPRDWPWSIEKWKIVKIVIVSALKSISTTITIMLWNVPQLPNTMKSSGAYNELQEKYGSDYMKISSDRSLLPDYKWFFNMSSQCMLENFGHISLLWKLRRKDVQCKKLIRIMPNFSAGWWKLYCGYSG